MQKIKTFIFYIFLGGALALTSYLLGSDFLNSFLKTNLLTILIALLAINIATIGIVFSKMEEIATRIEQYGGVRPFFKETKEEAILSVKEQLWMIGLTVVISVVCGSEYCIKYPYIKHVAEGALSTVLIWALFVLYDTSNAVFLVLNVKMPENPKQ